MQKARRPLKYILHRNLSCDSCLAEWDGTRCQTWTGSVICLQNNNGTATGAKTKRKQQIIINKVITGILAEK